MKVAYLTARHRRDAVARVFEGCVVLTPNARRRRRNEASSWYVLVSMMALARSAKGS